MFMCEIPVLAPAFSKGAALGFFFVTFLETSGTETDTQGSFNTSLLDEWVDEWINEWVH